MMPFLHRRIPFRASLWLAARLLPFFTRGQLDRMLKRATPPIFARAYQELSWRQILDAVQRTVRNPRRMRGRRCLREGLLAFYYLTLAGYGPLLHFGLVPGSLSGSRPRAHCWITLGGTCVLNPPEAGMVELFVYDGNYPRGFVAHAAIKSARYG
jgi:hypothetical protein